MSDAGVQHHREQRHTAADHLHTGKHSGWPSHVRAAVRPTAGAEGAGKFLPPPVSYFTVFCGCNSGNFPWENNCRSAHTHTTPCLINLSHISACAQLVARDNTSPSFQGVGSPWCVAQKKGSSVIFWPLTYASALSPILSWCRLCVLFTVEQTNKCKLNLPAISVTIRTPSPIIELGLTQTQPHYKMV